MASVIPLPCGWGEAGLIRRDERQSDSRGIHSYDHEGNQLRWLPPATANARFAACDIERRDRDVSFLATHFGIPEREFLPAWVTTEVMAKLADIPILIWLKERGLVTPSHEVPTHLRLANNDRARSASVLVIPTAERFMAFGLAH